LNQKNNADISFESGIKHRLLLTQRYSLGIDALEQLKMSEMSLAMKILDAVKWPR